MALCDFVLWSLKYREADLVSKGRGSVFHAIGKNDLESLEILLPSTDIQRRIISILNQASRINYLHKHKQMLLGRLAPALFISLFGDPIDNPMGWKISTLGNLCTFAGGGTPSRKKQLYWNGNIPWVSVKDFHTDCIIEPQESISELGLKHSSSKLIPARTVLVVTRVGLGKIAISGIDVAINQDIKALFPIDELTPDYLLYSLKNFSSVIMSKGAGATVKGVTLSDLQEIPIPVPPLGLQHQFISLLSRARKLYSLSQNQNIQSNTLSSSLIHFLLKS